MKESPSPSFRALFERAQGVRLVLETDEPRYTILAASNDYLRATTIGRDRVLGRGLVEVLAGGGRDPTAVGRQMSASLANVLTSRAPDAMPIQRYEVRRAGSSAEFEERFWSIVNTPVLDGSGAVRYIVSEWLGLEPGSRETEVERQRRAQALREAHLRLRELDGLELQMVAIANDGMRPARVLDAGNARRLLGDPQRAILDVSLDCIVAMDHRGLVTEFNAAAERTFGYTRQQAVGAPLAELMIPPRLRQAHRNGLKRHLESGQGPVLGRRIVMSGMRSDGSEFPLELSICRVPGADPPEFIGFIRDLTESEQVKEALRVAEERRFRYEAEAAARVERERADTVARESELRLLHEQAARAAAEEGVRARDEFVAVAGHELKTPLAALMMQVQVFRRLKREDWPANLVERIERIERSGRRLGSLLDQLLDVSRLTGGGLRLEPTPGDLVQMVAGVVDRFTEASAQQDCVVSLRGDARVEGCWDRLRIESTIVNLLSNAIKFGRGKPVEIEVLAEDGHGVVRVTDHGVGIDAGAQQKLFQKFERAVGTREFGGFGLGLWICRNIVEESGGTIEVQSEPDRGATFIVRLPLQPKVPAHAH